MYQINSLFPEHKSRPEFLFFKKHQKKRNLHKENYITVTVFKCYRTCISRNVGTLDMLAVLKAEENYQK